VTAEPQPRGASVRYPVTSPVSSGAPRRVLDRSLFSALSASIVVLHHLPGLSWAAHADRAAQPAEWNDGSGRSRIVSRPGGAARTFGIEFTTTDAVAMSPGTPLCIRKDSGGVPSI
jgi:hypothetical protein